MAERDDDWVYRVINLLAGFVVALVVLLLGIAAVFGQFFKPDYRTDDTLAALFVGALLTLAGVATIKWLPTFVANRRGDPGPPDEDHPRSGA